MLFRSIPPSLGFGGPMHTLLIGLDDFVILQISTLKKIYQNAIAKVGSASTPQAVRDQMILEILALYNITSPKSALVKKSKLFICKPPLFVPSEYKGEDISKLQFGGGLSYSKHICGFIFRPDKSELSDIQEQALRVYIKKHRNLMQQLIRTPKFQVDMNDWYSTSKL